MRGTPYPANFTGYHSQIRFFQQHYPTADLHIQRGMEIYVVKPLLLPSPHEGEGLGVRGILRADICEDGHLKGGLKRRRVYRLVIQPGVELCPTPSKKSR